MNMDGQDGQGKRKPLKLKILLIANPASGACRGRQIRRLHAACTARGLHADLRLTARRGDATWIAATADLTRYDALVAAGGDGTLFEVLNGLYQKPAAERLPLGIVPLGTGNAFARHLGLLPGAIGQALDIIATGRRRDIDVAEIDHAGGQCYSLNIAGLGFATDAAVLAARFKALGGLAYSAGSLLKMMNPASFTVRILAGGEVITSPCLLFEIANTRYTGSRFLIAPAARFDDGLLDWILVKPMARRRLLRLFPSVYRGRHIAYPEVVTGRAGAIDIVAPADYPLTIDGEIIGRTPARIRCLPGDVGLLCA